MQKKKKVNKSEFIMKRKDNYWWEQTLVKLLKPLIIRLVDSPITPNMVTLFNMLVVLPVICVVAYFRIYYLLAILIQIYACLDIVDGNLARNKNMKSELGRKLDILADTIFFTVGYTFVGIGMKVHWGWIVVFIGVQQIYGIIATFFIVPRLQRIENFKHTKVKQFFFDRGIIFGMDAIMETLITSILLLLPIRKGIFMICPILWGIDLIYRLYELLCVNRNVR